MTRVLDPLGSAMLKSVMIDYKEREVVDLKLGHRMRRGGILSTSRSGTTVCPTLAT